MWGTIRRVVSRANEQESGVAVKDSSMRARDLPPGRHFGESWRFTRLLEQVGLPALVSCSLPLYGVVDFSTLCP